MIRATVLLCLLALPLRAETVAEQATKASVELQEAVAALDAATEARDRVTALSQTIRAYEAGLAALRGALREAALREATLTRAFDAKRDGIGRLLGILATMEANPGPLLLLHPEGAVGSARSGMILADVTPALQSEALALKSQLQELADLRALQLSAGEVLERGLATAQTARTELSKAISDRTDLPKRFTEDPEVLKGLLDSADTLDAFAAGLSPDTEADTSFAGEKGRLPLPVLGTVLRLPDEADAAGVRRPGVTLATQARALVTAPWPATIRYRGPLLDYGNVMILEPGDGYLLVLAGMETLYGEVGEVVAAEAPLGLMGGPRQATAEFVAGSPDGSGGRDTETLYMELRQGALPVDPMDWFAGLARTGD
ncbi:peptidoglycan DD-metalloendopeptidase family protein [Tabrizicola sp.]|jgi:septal ring factor EnvC (AmiA/AmiB activator)|uniref:murein hydrolase activator EnvC family protein n=1 Tax=Tabrizicola sp. TaxID=2005166 RepID=UPI001A4BC30C|nr:peptidoglycan DD-metalloendopeptidase family protein [Tabrizicola sp.]MBL9063982.1 peptidoglycan DD-metalloendopeptidase family protein [Tabrizicola sp.]